MSPTEPSSAAKARPETSDSNFIQKMWGVRYQVRDVARAVDFYVRQLGFHLDQQHLPAFAQVSIEGLKLILSGPGASGSRPMPDGRAQEPGGWNRVVLHVAELPSIHPIEYSRGARGSPSLRVPDQGPGRATSTRPRGSVVLKVGRSPRHH